MQQRCYSLARDGDRYAVEAVLPAVDHDIYVRVRATSTYVRVHGTRTEDLDLPIDDLDENPWRDRHGLWFYFEPDLHRDRVTEPSPRAHPSSRRHR
jgi:hypothetical protein